MMMKKLRSKRLSRSFSMLRCGRASDNESINNSNTNNSSFQEHVAAHVEEIKWELRPGGMLVQKREIVEESIKEGVLMIRVTTVSQWHDISIQATSTFGELKAILSIVTGFEPTEQRLLFKGKEREDEEYLHMVGVRDKDKVLMLQDPATKERKLIANAIGAPHRTITV